VENESGAHPHPFLASKSATSGMTRTWVDFFAAAFAVPGAPPSSAAAFAAPGAPTTEFHGAVDGVTSTTSSSPVGSEKAAADKIAADKVVAEISAADKVAADKPA